MCVKESGKEVWEENDSTYLTVTVNSADSHNKKDDDQRTKHLRNDEMIAHGCFFVCLFLARVISMLKNKSDFLLRPNIGLPRSELPKN